MHKRSFLLLIFNMFFPALTAASFLFALPNDGVSAVFWGLSKSRLLVAITFVVLAVLFATLTVLASLHWEQTIRLLVKHLNGRANRNFMLALDLFFLLIMAVALNIPDKYLGGLIAIRDRIQPILIWFFLTCLQMLIGIIIFEINKQTLSFSEFKKRFIPASLALCFSCATWLVISSTGLGLNSANTFWSKIGVPVLWSQIGAALLIGLGVFLVRNYFEKKPPGWVWFDILLMILIWTAAVVLWNNQTYQPGVFNTTPRPPTYELYPINDSQIFDVGAQKLLVGQNMIADVIDKPIYISFLAILHFFAGYSYAQFYFLQILVFALIPICGFLIGKNLHSPTFGTMFSVILIFKELNAIAVTNYIHVSTSKLILSEMLTTLGLLLFTYFLLNWMKSAELWNKNLYLAGGVLGITSLVRLNSIGLLPFVILIIGFSLKFNLKRWIFSSLFFCTFLIISVVPWVVRNTVVTGDPFHFIDSKTTGVIGNQRYNPIIKSTQSLENQSLKQSSAVLLVQNITNNYLHNLIGITLMVPPSSELYNVLDLVRLPYWKLDWAGGLLPGGFWFVLGILILTSIGLGSAWNRWRFTGLVPLAVLSGYNLTTAISLTSGGRYLVPMDWGVLLYFSLGLLEVVLALMNLFGWLRHQDVFTPISHSVSKLSLQQIVLIGLMFLFIGSIPVMLEFLPKQIYPAVVTMADFMRVNQSLPELQNSSIGSNISTFENIPGSVVIYGKVLYPRYFGQNKGEGPTIEQEPLVGSASFDHLAFLVIGGDDTVPVILPSNQTFSSQIAGSDAWVIGCKRQNYLEAIFVVFKQSNFIRSYSEDPLKKTCQ